jgi:predicted DNA-binding transcriptional regulator YafY
MRSPTSRLLELLELLQTEALVTGREIADRLAVDRRTVRRDVATLQELGIPVEGERGVGGGYRLRPGFRLPPLMLSEDEATAVVLGLTAASRLGLGDAGGTDGALVKIRRVLPATLPRRGARVVAGVHGSCGHRRAARGRDGAAAGGSDPSPPACRHHIPLVRGRGDGA